MWRFNTANGQDLKPLSSTSGLHKPFQPPSYSEISFSFNEVSRHNYAHIPCLNAATYPAHYSLWFILSMLHPLGKTPSFTQQKTDRPQCLPRHGREEKSLLLLQVSCQPLKGAYTRTMLTATTNDYKYWSVRMKMAHIPFQNQLHKQRLYALNPHPPQPNRFLLGGN